MIGYQKWFAILNLFIIIGESFLSSIRNYFLSLYIKALSNLQEMNYNLLRLILVIIIHSIISPLRSIAAQLLAASMAKEMRARLF